MHTCFQTPLGQAHPQWDKTALLAPLIGLLMLLVSAGPVWAETFTFTAVITSGQEPPPNTNDSEAFGVAFVTFNAETGELCFSISYDESVLTSAETNAHFHAPAPRVERAMRSDASRLRRWRAGDPHDAQAFRDGLKSARQSHHTRSPAVVGISRFPRI